MASFSPIPSYIFGTVFTGIGLLSIFAPEVDYDIFGLPLEPSPKQTVSPMLYAKGVRDLAFGLTYFALQYQGLDEAVTLFSGVLTFVALADGYIVWRHGGEKLKGKAFGHWGGLVPFAAWVAWRAQSS